ncbi:MAG: DUF4835 family protein [Flavobacteriales bacterium]|nr:DUF4835 family protein [Flavobacteriales bacterium]
MWKYLGAIVGALFLSFTSSAQELNAEVNIIAPQLSNVEESRLESIEGAIQEFLNGRRWTNDNFNIDERIECSFQLTISEAPTQTSFRGSLQIQSSRPVYNSDYKTPVLTVNDNDVTFNFADNQILQWSIDQHRDNLTSLLAYYAYMIIGMDYDTFSNQGGTDYFLKAQTIVANAQNAGDTGWRANEGQRNRFWLVENILSQSFTPLRECLYNYHRHGFDKLYTDTDTSRETIKQSLMVLREVHKVRPSSYNIQLFFVAKSDEIINLFQPASEEVKSELGPLLKLLDPGNIQKYQQLSS